MKLKQQEEIGTRLHAKNGSAFLDLEHGLIVTKRGTMTLHGATATVDTLVGVKGPDPRYLAVNIEATDGSVQYKVERRNAANAKQFADNLNQMSAITPLGRP